MRFTGAGDGPDLGLPKDGWTHGARPGTADRVLDTLGLSDPERREAYHASVAIVEH